MNYSDQLNTLKKYFDLKKKKNPNFSLRNLARTIKISPSYLSRVFSGKKKLTLKIYSLLVHVLEVPEEDKFLDNTQFANLTLKSKKSKIQYDLEDVRKTTLLDNWFLLPILELTTCKDYDGSIEYISLKLGLSEYDIKRALGWLQARGYLKKNKMGILKKSRLKLKIPTTKVHEKVQNYHIMQMYRATRVLKYQIEEKDFDQRLITGATFAIDKSKIDQIKKILSESLYEVVDLATEGSCQDVYQLNIQFFPHTKGKI